MTIQRDNISFDVPEGFEDITSYDFRNQLESEELKVVCAPLPPEASDLPSLVAARRAEIDAKFDFLFDSVSIQDHLAQLGDFPAHVLFYILKRGDDYIHERLALALIDSDSYVQLSYTTRPELVQDAEVKFNHIVQSVSLYKIGESLKTSRGYTRYQAGRVVLDVPDSLLPPSTYHFISSDKQMSLSLTIHNQTTNSGQFRTLEQEIADSIQYGAVIKDRQTQEISTDHGEAVITSFIEEIEEPWAMTQRAVCLIQLRLDNGARFTLRGHSPAAQQEIIKDKTLTLMHSIKAHQRLDGCEL